MIRETVMAVLFYAMLLYISTYEKWRYNYELVVFWQL